MKDLNQLTPGELGQLFPVRMVDYNHEWPKLASVEKKNIVSTVGIKLISRIEHIGSTAVPGLCAKPTIDFLLEIPDNTDCDILINQLKKIGYYLISKPENPPPHMMFAKGYSPSGISGQTFHVHVRYPGDWDEILFRDFLISNPQTASEYGKLKKELATNFENDREKYTGSKTVFIKNVILKARKEEALRRS
jgi:GrpB-like predicted nucleotidyltransferase (UPF0157 family)